MSRTTKSLKNIKVALLLQTISAVLVYLPAECFLACCAKKWGFWADLGENKIIITDIGGYENRL